MSYKDKQLQSQYQNNWMKVRRETWIQENGPCDNCGSWENLEVDHINPSTKISHRIWSWKLEKRLLELSKCHVLCSACHLEKSKIDLSNMMIGTRIGELSPSAKISNEQALQIRYLYNTNNYSLRCLGNLYNISHTQIRRIVNNSIDNYL